MQALKRHIEDGREYEKYFNTPMLGVLELPQSNVYETLEHIANLVQKTLSQTKKISQKLRGKNRYESCKNIWNFLYSNIQYEADTKGIEQLRTPNRSWADRKTGIDCDCFSVFASSILSNLNIPHALRMAKYNGKENFQHVYVIVPKNGNKIKGQGTYIVIDPVLDYFDYEKPYTQKHDFMIKIPHQILNGIEETKVIDRLPFGQEFEALQTLGNVSDTHIADTFMLATKAHLQNTLQEALNNPEGLKLIGYSPRIFITQLQYILKNWDDPVARQGALEEVAEMETLQEGINGLGTPLKEKDILQKLHVLNQRRDRQPRVIPATIERGTLQRDLNFKNQVRNIPTYFYQSERSLEGLNGLDGFFKRVFKGVKNVADKVGKTVNDVSKSAGKTISTIVKNTGKEINKGVTNLKNSTRDLITQPEVLLKNVKGNIKDVAIQSWEKIKRINPLSVLARGGFLGSMKLNLFKIASKLKWGYLSEAEARKRHLNLNDWRKAKERIAKTEHLFENTLGGKKENLKNAILKGKAGGLGSLGAEPLTTGAAISAAAGFVAKVADWVKDMKEKLEPVIQTGQKVQNAVQKATKALPILNINTRQKANTVNVTPVHSPAPPDRNNYTPPIQNEPQLKKRDEENIKEEKKDSKKSNTLLIVGSLGLAIIGGLYYQSQQRKKALNGIPSIEF